MRTGDSPFMTIEDIAAYTRNAVSTVRGWRLRGILPPAYRHGGSLRWDRNEIVAWALSNREEVTRHGDH